MALTDIGRYAALSTVFVLLAGCAGSQTQTEPALAPAAAGAHSSRPAKTQYPIAHLIVVVQRDRSFDDLFAGFPGADAPTRGLTSNGRSVPLQPVGLSRPPCSLQGSYAQYFATAFDGGKMDGWDRLDPQQPLCPYTRVKTTETRPYWNLAKSFTLADRMFASTHFGEFANRLYLIAGTTLIGRATYVVGPPQSDRWGCEAPLDSRTSILKNGNFEPYSGPFPCFNQFPTIANRLDGAGVSWKYYYDRPGQGGAGWNPFDAIKDVFEGRDWKRDMSSPATNVFADISAGRLDAVSWVSSPVKDSDGPATGGGPAWVNAIVRAVKTSPYWKSTAIVVVWDDAGSGQFYDNVAPPQLDPVGLGFRVPLLIVSPYAKRGYVAHTQYEFGSILKFIEENWNLPPLGGGATDKRANSISDAFDFSR